MDETETKTFAGKLEAFYGTLTDDEQQAFISLAESAVDDEVGGFAYGMGGNMFWGAVAVGIARGVVSSVAAPKGAQAPAGNAGNAGNATNTGNAGNAGNAS